jgi:serine/threonine protein kinase
LDVWSCAIVYLTLNYKGNPWPAADVKHTNYERFETGWKKYLERFPDGLVLDDRSPSCGPVFRYLNNSSMRRLLLRMLHPDPKKRITIKDVLADRHYKSIECCAPDLLKDPSKAVTSIDAGSKGSCRMANKMLVQKIHNHFPPEKRFMPPHRFETGEE